MDKGITGIKARNYQLKIVNKKLKESQKGMIKIEDVEKMIDERILEVKQWNLTKASKEDYNATRRWQIRIIIEFEDLKQSLKELGDK